MNNLRSLKEEIAELDTVTMYLQNGAAIDLKLMQEATSNSLAVLRKINELISWSAYNEDLDKFMRAMLSIVTQLHAVTEEHTKDVPSPNKLLEKISSASQNYFQKIIAKEQDDQGWHDWILSLSYVGKVVHFIEFIPSGWHHCTTAEKAAIILCATLAMTAAAVMIATCFSPAVAAVPFIGAAMNSILSLSGALYGVVTARAMKRHDDQVQIEQIKMDLKDQQRFIKSKFSELAMQGVNKLTKEELTYLHGTESSKAQKTAKDKPKSPRAKGKAYGQTAAKSTTKHKTTTKNKTAIGTSGSKRGTRHGKEGS
jgi:hypothetical protein